MHRLLVAFAIVLALGAGCRPPVMAAPPQGPAQPWWPGDDGPDGDRTPPAGTTAMIVTSMVVAGAVIGLVVWGATRHPHATR